VTRTRRGFATCSRRRRDGPRSMDEARAVIGGAEERASRVSARSSRCVPRLSSSTHTARDTTGRVGHVKPEMVRAAHAEAAGAVANVSWARETE